LVSVAAAANSPIPGTLVHWGAPNWGVRDIPPEVRDRAVAVAVAEYHAMAIDADGVVYA